MTNFLLSALSFVLLCSVSSFNIKNNACRTFSAYFFRFFSKKCYHNDEYYMNTPQLLHHRNMPYENHTVITEDGYILSMFRVLQENPKDVIVFLHPMTQDSRCWFAGLNDSYVSTFFNAGYEIWLPNFRGTAFSDKHIKKLKELEYWDFSLTELGKYDCSAITSYIFNITQKRSIVLSHSMGSTGAAIYASMKPEEAKQFVKIFLSMTTTAFMGGPSPIRLFIIFVPVLKVSQRIFNFGAFFTKYRGAILFMKKIYNSLPTAAVSAIIGAIAGTTIDGYPFNVNPEYIPMIVSFSSQPVGVKIYLHYLQFLSSGKFADYDHGKTKNLQVYNTEQPPNFPVENISVPYYLLYGAKDALAYKKGSELFYSKLPEEAKIYGKYEIKHYGHVDFILARDVVEVVQMKLLDLLDSI